VRYRRRSRQVGAKVELRPEEDNPEEKCQDANPLCLAEHLGTNTELRTKWFHGQGRRTPTVFLLKHRPSTCCMQEVKVKIGLMNPMRIMFGRTVVRRAEVY
jgi:hypothetical protein